MDALEAKWRAMGKLSLASDQEGIRRQIDALLDPAMQGEWPKMLRELWVGQLDFASASGHLSVKVGEAQVSVLRLAERDGITVLGTVLPRAGYVRARDVQQVMKELKPAVEGNFVLCASNENGDEWQFAWPTTEDGRQVVKRMGAQRGHPFRTLTEQLDAIDGNARSTGLLWAIEEAFNVEPVTRKFFAAYKDIFNRVLQTVDAPSLQESARRLFCQTLFNRLMFIYFLQRKGCLKFNGSADYLHAIWNAYLKSGQRSEASVLDVAAGSDTGFYTTRLRNLFFVLLANPRSEEYKDARKALEPQLGSPPFLNGGLFSEEPFDGYGVASVPDEAIRLIIEELFDRFNFTITESTPSDIQVAVDPEMLGKVFEELVIERERHGRGSYYTPRAVVQFMCDQAATTLLKDRVAGVSGSILERYVEAYDVSLLTPEQAESVVAALSDLRVVDPACGSGAYLLGMLQKLLELRRPLWSAQLRRDAHSDHQHKLHIIRRNLFGADIDPFAVNIARLRLWLSLTVDFEGSEPEPLPNLDFNIVCGDSLTAPAPPALEQQVGMFQDIIAQTASRIAERKARYFSITGPEKHDLGREIDQDMDRLGQSLEVHAPSGAVQWEVQFAEAFQNGGFDIVLANPPYVRADEDDQTLEYRRRLKASGVYDTLFEKWDVYVAFLERGHQLLGPRGSMVFIVSDAINAAKYGERARRFFLSGAVIKRIDFCSDIPLFAAGVRNTILHFFRALPTGLDVPERVLRTGDSPLDFSRGASILPSTAQTLADESIFKPDWRSEIRAVFGTHLGEICYVSKGMVLHSNERLARRQFRAEDLVSLTQDHIHSRPYTEGKWIDRWRIRRTAFLEWGTDRSPALLSRPTFPELYSARPKLISIDIASGAPRVAYDDQGLMHNHSAWSFVRWCDLRGVSNRSITKSAVYWPSGAPSTTGAPDRERLERLSARFLPKYLLAVMNSSDAKQYLWRRRRSALHLFPNDWKGLPIPEASRPDQDRICALVDRLLETEGAQRLAGDEPQDSASERLELEIDALVSDEYAKASNRAERDEMYIGLDY